MDSAPFSAHATSRMSSEVCSPISTSPLEQSLHNVPHLDCRNSADTPSTVVAKRSRSADLAGGVPSLEEVHPVWLEASPDERYLLLEDAETGDMLMPLIYMKTVFEANYSRKLSSLKHRLVVNPADAGLPSPQPNTYLYWQWAFEAPNTVKLLVRRELGEDNSPQGHLRLLLLPIVYNAMALKEELRQLPLFRALQRAMRASTYDCLLRHPPPGLHTPEKIPSSELAATTEAGILPESDSQPQLFSGPRDLAATAAKYMVSFREAEENTFKMRRVRMVHSGSHAGVEAIAAAEAAAAATSELRCEMREWKRRVESQLEGVFGELAVVKNCIMQLYSVLLPGKIPTSGAPPHHFMQQPPQTQPPPQSLASSALPPQHPSYQQVQMQERRGGLPCHTLATAPQPPRMPGQLHGSTSGDSLKSRGPCEGSNESATSPMHLPAVAAVGYALPANMWPQVSTRESLVTNGLWRLPSGQLGSSRQLMGHGSMLGNPPILGGLCGGDAALGMQSHQLTNLPRVLTHQHQARIFYHKQHPDLWVQQCLVWPEKHSCTY